MRISLLGKRVCYVRLFSGEGICGRHLAGTDILVIINSKYAGQFAVPRWLDYYSSGQTRELRYQLVPNLYLVFRQAIEILYRYGRVFEDGENKKMWQAIEAAQNLNQTIIRPRGKAIDSLTEQLSGKVDSILSGIGQARNPAKKRAVTRLNQVSTLYDSLDRINPGAKRATVLAARRDLQRRLYSEMAFIEPKIAMRLWAVGKTLDFAEYILADARSFLSAIEKYLGDHKNISGYVAERMISRLVYIAENLNLLDFQPFVANYRLSVFELERATEKIRDQEFGQARALIRRARQSLKVKTIQGAIENLILKISLDLLNRKESDRTGYLLVLGMLIADLKRIDERGFKRRVCRRAVNWLYKASREMSAGRWQEGKDFLKKASEAMTWY